MTRGKVVTLPTALDKFTVDLASGCMVWSGLLDRNGYGTLRFRGRNWFAHRLSWTYANGDIPDGMLVLHRCDNPPCIRPDHLFIGTQADNIADAQAKGRLATGERGLVCKRGHAKAVHYRRYPAGGRGCEECRRERRAGAA